MKGLLMKVSALDADAAAALKVIEYYDSLVANRVTMPALVRATAFFAECIAGLSQDGGREVWRFSPEGTPAKSSPAISISGEAELGPGVRVWLERAGGPGPLDELVLERVTIAARSLLAPGPTHSRPGLADPALVELVLAESQAVEDRYRALRLLGLEPAMRFRVLVARVDSGVNDASSVLRELIRGLGPARTSKVALVGDVAVAVLQSSSRDATEIATSLRTGLGRKFGDRPGHSRVRVGIGPSVEAVALHGSWEQARIALRFAGPGDDALIIYEELGPLTLLGEVPIDRLRAEPTVRALETLAATPSGVLELAALEALCRTGSQRRAAIELHLHHSSVKARLVRVERLTGWNLDMPADVFRAQVALRALRLTRSITSGQETQADEAR
jgi:hypothetical protein